MIDPERSLRNTIPLPPITSRSNIHLVSRQPYNEDIDLWSDYHPHKPLVSTSGFLLNPAVYPFALILLDLITGGTGKALGGLIGLLAGHLWWVTLRACKSCSL
jgi:hypothetical protein